MTADRDVQKAREILDRRIAESPGMSIERQQLMHDALNAIARGYATPDQIRRYAHRVGLSYLEALEMAYASIQDDARAAIRGVRRPKEKASASG